MGLPRLGAARRGRGTAARTRVYARREEGGVKDTVEGKASAEISSDLVSERSFCATQFQRGSADVPAEDRPAPEPEAESRLRQRRSCCEWPHRGTSWRHSHLALLDAALRPHRWICVIQETLDCAQWLLKILNHPRRPCGPPSPTAPQPPAPAVGSDAAATPPTG